MMKDCGVFSVVCLVCVQADEFAGTLDLQITRWCAMKILQISFNTRCMLEYRAMMISNSKSKMRS